LLQRHDVHAGAARPIESFIHAFSHYHLRITPLVLAGAQAAKVADRIDSGWFAVDELDSLGLPAPVRKLLATLEDYR
jgi:A/G-specific adenine glycosylase